MVVIHTKRDTVSSCKELSTQADHLDDILKISRRDFAGGLCALAACAPIPLSVAASEEKLKVVWHGLSYMEKCDDDCVNLDRTFPNIRKIMADEDKAKLIWKPITDSVRSIEKGDLPIEVIIPMGDNPDVGQPDVGMVLAITSEADIASRNYRDSVINEDATLLIYEIQCYSIIFEFKKLRVMNSFPIRLWRADKISGQKKKDSLEDWFFKVLSGQGIEDSTTLPAVFAKKLGKIDFRRTEPMSIRVTNIELRRMAAKWVAQQNKTENELKSLIGNSLTSAISETLNIGIQPFSVNKSLGDLAYTLSTSGASADIFNTLDLRDPDLDIRLALRGVITKVKKKDERFNSYRITIGVEITAARYDYEFTQTGGVKTFVKETLIETILKQKLRAISVEVATGTWRNDWYWVIDLHHALFEWFFASIIDPDKIQSMTKGHQRKHKTRKFFFQVYNKDSGAFENEANRLKEKLLAE